jgi:hypothetical protein
VVIPLLSLLLVILDGGMFFSRYETATNEVREAARCAVIGGSDANVIARVQNNVGDVTNVTVTHNTDDNGDSTAGGIGDNVKVSATWTYTWISPLSSLGFSPTMTKTSTADMRLETDEFTEECPN